MSDKVTYIPAAPVANRFMSSTANILAAAESGELSDRFIVLNDDIFVLRPMEYRHEHRCSIEEYLTNGGSAGAYLRHAIATCDLLKAHGVDDPLFFGLHTPTVYDRDKLVDLIHEFSGQEYLLRTLYHNLHPAPSERRDDVKLYSWQGEPKADDYLSTSDSCALSPHFRRWIQRKFPRPCEYERTP